MAGILRIVGIGISCLCRSIHKDSDPLNWKRRERKSTTCALPIFVVREGRALAHLRSAEKWPISRVNDRRIQGGNLFTETNDALDSRGMRQATMQRCVDESGKQIARKHRLDESHRSPGGDFSETQRGEKHERSNSRRRCDAARCSRFG